MLLEVPEGKKRILLHCCCAPCSGAVVECLVQNGLRPTLFFSNSNIVPREEYELRRSELTRYARLFGLEVVDDEYDHEAWLDFVLNRRREISRQARNDRVEAGVASPEDLAMTVASPDNLSATAVDLATAQERGPRCLRCFKFRLQRAAQYAAANGYDVLTTTLASSRWKSLEQVDEAGRWACTIMQGDKDCSTKLLSLDQRDLGAELPEGDGEAVRGSSLPRPLGVQGNKDCSTKPLWWNQNWRKGGLQPRRSEIIKEQQFYNQTFCGCEFSRPAPSPCPSNGYF